MTLLRALAFVLVPHAGIACGAPVCLVDPASLVLTQVITFDGVRSSFGPGYYVDDVLVLDGARFAERFAGQTVDPTVEHDAIFGKAYGPLTLMPGQRGQNLSVVIFFGNAMLTGYGTAGYPKREAQGEGAIAVLFDEDQAAFSFELRGGEGGAARVLFLARNGGVIGETPVEPTGEFAVGFQRADGIADIAGFVMTNTDPQGVAMDTLRFGKPPELG